MQPQHNSTHLFSTFREEIGGGYFRIKRISDEQWFWQIDADDMGDPRAPLQEPVKVVGPFVSAVAAFDNAYWS